MVDSELAFHGSFIIHVYLMSINLLQNRRNAEHLIRSRCIYLYTCMYMYVCMYVCVYVCVRVYVCMHVCMYTSEMPLFRKFPEITKFQIERMNFRKNETVSLDKIIDQKGGKRFWKKGNLSKFTY